MRFLAIAVLLLSIEYLSAQSHDDDDDDDMSAAEAFKLLCAADENHMEELYSYCQRTELKDAVDGVMQMCFIEVRNKRAPTTRLDAKYYQFVMCDWRIYSQFIRCTFGKLRELQVSYNALQNMSDFFNKCLIETLKAMKDEIENQDEEQPTKKRMTKHGNRNRPNNQNQIRPKNTQDFRNKHNDHKSLKLRPGRY